jgi:hypothetical protein
MKLEHKGAKQAVRMTALIFLVGIVGDGVQLGPLGTTAATNRLIVPAPGWLWWRWNRWNDWQGKPKDSKKTYPSAALSTTDLTCCPDANPGSRGGKPQTNRLSYGTAMTALRRLIFIKWLPLVRAELKECFKLYSSTCLHCVEFTLLSGFYMLYSVLENDY